MDNGERVYVDTAIHFIEARMISFSYIEQIEKVFEDSGKLSIFIQI